MLNLACVHVPLDPKNAAYLWLETWPVNWLNMYRGNSLLTWPYIQVGVTIQGLHMRSLLYSPNPRDLPGPCMVVDRFRGCLAEISIKIFYSVFGSNNIVIVTPLSTSCGIQYIGRDKMARRGSSGRGSVKKRHKSPGERRKFTFWREREIDRSRAEVKNDSFAAASIAC